MILEDVVDGWLAAGPEGDAGGGAALFGGEGERAAEEAGAEVGVVGFGGGMGLRNAECGLRIGYRVKDGARGFGLGGGIR